MSKLLNRKLKVYLFDYVNYLVLFGVVVVILYPLINIISMSFSSTAVPFGASFRILPYEFTLASYINILGSQYIYTGLIMTVQRTVFGTLLTVIISLFVAYPLSKKYFPGRTQWTLLIVFTMFFNGGLIPRYLLVKNLNLLDNIFSLILPILINTFNMIVMRNFLMTIPAALEESARIDGANDIQILFLIIVPVSAPMIATISLWTAVAHWNAWFDSMIYTSDARKHVLQVVLRRVLLEGTQQVFDNSQGQSSANDFSIDTIKAATVMVAMLPIVIVYPFVQKYFVKGVMVGSLKG